MLANFFSKSKPVNFIIIIVLFLVYFVLGNFMYSFESINLDLLVTLPLYLGVFFLYNFIIAKNRLTKDDSYAFLLFVIGLGCLPQLNIGYELLVKYAILFLFLRRVYSLRTLKSVYEKLFDSGLWLGVLFLASPEYVLYLFLLFSAVLLFIKTTFRTVVIPVLGFLTPIFLFFTYHFYVDTLAVFYELFDIGFELEFSNYNTTSYGVISAVFGVFTFVSILLKTGRIFSVSNTFKRSWSLLIIHLLVSLSTLLLMPQKNGAALIAILIPSTILIANWIQSVERKLIINVVLLIFLMMSFVVHFIA